MNGAPGTRRTVWSGCLLLILAAGAVSSETLTPIRDGSGNVLGNFELWKKKKLGGKKFNLLTGWVAYLNGYKGKALITRVQGSKGFAAKGSVQQVNHHGRKAQIPPRLELGSRFVPYQNFIRGEGIPFSSRPAKIRGRYQFHAKGGSSFRVFLQLEKGGKEIAQAYLRSNDEVEEWQSFEIPVTYFNNEVPDRCFLTVDILGKQTGNQFDVPVRGSFYMVDEFTFVD